jgi:hypothetical protein
MAWQLLSTSSGGELDEQRLESLEGNDHRVADINRSRTRDRSRGGELDRIQVGYGGARGATSEDGPRSGAKRTGENGARVSRAGSAICRRDPDRSIAGSCRCP